MGLGNREKKTRTNVLLVWSGSYEKSGTRNPNVGIVECGRTDRRNIKYAHQALIFISIFQLFFYAV